MVGRAPHRQRVQLPLPGLLIQQRPPGERVGIEQAREGSDGIGEIHEPIVEGPWRDGAAKPQAEREVRRLAGFDAGR
jgi:hypothetical protein